MTPEVNITPVKCGGDLMLVIWQAGNGDNQPHPAHLVVLRQVQGIWQEEDTGPTVNILELAGDLGGAPPATLTIAHQIPHGLSKIFWNYKVELRQVDTEVVADEHIFVVDMTDCP